VSASLPFRSYSVFPLRERDDSYGGVGGGEQRVRQERIERAFQPRVKADTLGIRTDGSCRALCGAIPEHSLKEEKQKRGEDISSLQFMRFKLKSKTMIATRFLSILHSISSSNIHGE